MSIIPPRRYHTGLPQASRKLSLAVLFMTISLSTLINDMSLQFIRWIRMHLANRSCYRRSLDALRPLMTHYL